LLEERDTLRAQQLEALKREVALGIEQAERGEVADFDPAHYKALIEKGRSKQTSS
jgi:hypothetical protein